MKARILGPVVLLAARAALAGATYYADPATGSGRGDGSAARPWRTLEEVARARRLRSGDTLLLGTGYHGDVTLEGENDEPVTIAAAPGREPRLGRLVLRRGRGWRIRGLAISPSFGEGGEGGEGREREPYRGDIVVLAEGGPSSDVVLEDCFVFTELDSSSWTAKEWMEAKSGIFSGRHGTGITLRNNHVLNTRFGIALSSPDSVCEGNVVRNFSADGIRVTRDGITLQYNVVRNIYVGSRDGDDNHDDGIQCFLFNKGTGTVRNVTIRGNILVQRDAGTEPPLATDMQGIGFFDGPLIDFVVEQNVVLVAHWHGVSLYDAQGCTIKDNACYSRWNTKAKPWVMLGTKPRVGGSRGNKVLGNMAHSFNLRADAEVVEEGNVSVKEQAFYGRMRELAAVIDGKFGRFHPVAKIARLTDEKGDPADIGPDGAKAGRKAKDAKPTAAPKRRGRPAPEAVGKFDARLVERLRAALEAGTRIKFFMQSVRADATVDRIDDDATLRVTVSRPRMEMSIRFGRLSLAERKSLALSCATRGDEGAHALVAFYALSEGDEDSGREHLRASGPEAAEVEGAFAAE